MQRRKRSILYNSFDRNTYARGPTIAARSWEGGIVKRYRISIITLLLALSWPAVGQPPSGATRFDVLRAKGVNAEITVFPVRLGARAMPEAGEALAILLERGGMRNVDWTTDVFPRAGEAAFQQMTTEFGDYVRQNATATEYALYAEVLGVPGKGIAEIRGTLVDKDGVPVWSYRQTPQDEEFRKVQPKEPLECIAMLVNALRGPLGLQDPFRADAFEGKLARRNAERVGLPTDSERTAMKKALLYARTELAGSRMAVFPVLVDGRPDRRQATHLAGVLNEENFGKAEVAAAQPAIEVQAVPNEQQRLWQMARAVREYLHRTPAAADYVLYADYTFAPGGRAFTVHFVVCDRNGEWVIVDFQNNHWPDFNSMQLNSGDDCDRLVIKRLKRLLR